MVTLTDEEILCLVGDSGPVAFPFADAETAETRELLVRCGLRSLAARELLLPADDDALVVVEDLSRLLQDRASAAVVALLEVETGDEHLTRYLFLDEDSLLVEDVSALGLHRIERVERGLLRRVLDEGLGALATREGDDPAPSWDTVLREGRVTADLVVMGPHVPATQPVVLHSALATPRGLYVTSALRDAAEAPALLPTGFAALCDAWSELIGGVLVSEPPVMPHDTATPVCG